jgi:alpha-N-arabinofuranosidase
MYTYENPVIKGYNPDPSICRAGDDFYLITSSFEYFPGVPVYKSRNLVNWELIGHCLSRPGQLKVDSAMPSGGIYAPTLRFYNGKFYMTTTNVSHKGNFIITADDPAGPWSDPVWITQGGIDPDLFFDDDGTLYFTSTGSDDGKTGIYICTLHPETFEQLTGSALLTEGGGGRFTEAPHIYKKDGYYYLLLAEGGTEYGHMVTIFRSRSVTGEYLPCPHNPILTHRGSNAQYNPIQATGHADMVTDKNGNWWLVALAIRPLPGVMLHNLGRETFLAKVEWDGDGWPVAGNGGTLELTMSAPLPEAPAPRDDRFFDDYSEIKKDYLHIRNPNYENYRRDRAEKSITLRGSGTQLNQYFGDSPTFLGVRQREFEMTAKAAVTVAQDGAKGGLVAYYSPDYHYAVYLSRYGGVTHVRTVRRVHNLEVKSARVPIYGDTAELCIVTGKDYYKLCYTDESGGLTELERGAAAGLCTEGTAAMTFNGTLLGLFAERGEVKFGEFEIV